MTALIIFICLTLGLAIMAGSFYWGYKVGIIKKNSDDDKVYLQNAMDHIKALEETIMQLEFDREELRRDLKRELVQRPSSWNPADPLNSMDR